MYTGMDRKNWVLLVCHCKLFLSAFWVEMHVHSRFLYLELFPLLVEIDCKDSNNILTYQDQMLLIYKSSIYRAALTVISIYLSGHLRTFQYSLSTSNWCVYELAVNEWQLTDCLELCKAWPSCDLTSCLGRSFNLSKLCEISWTCYMQNLCFIFEQEDFTSLCSCYALLFLTVCLHMETMGLFYRITQ